MAKKRKCQSLFLTADPSTFSRRTGNTHTHTLTQQQQQKMFRCLNLILRAQCLVSVKGNMLQGDMVKKKHPAVAHFAEELQNRFSNPYVDSHGSAQIRHRTTTHNSAAFSLPV